MYFNITSKNIYLQFSRQILYMINVKIDNLCTYIWIDLHFTEFFLAFQIAKYLLYINDRIVNVCKYIYIYTLPTFLHQCLFHFVAQRNQKVYWNSKTKRISITYPEKKGFDEPILWVVFKRDYHKIHSFLCINCQTTPVLWEKRSLNLFVEVTLRRNFVPRSLFELNM